MPEAPVRAHELVVDGLHGSARRIRVALGLGDRGDAVHEVERGHSARFEIEGVFDRGTVDRPDPGPG